MSSIHHDILMSKIRKIEFDRSMRMTQSFMLNEVALDNQPLDMELTGPPVQLDKDVPTVVKPDKVKNRRTLGGAIAKGFMRGGAEAGLKIGIEKGLKHFAKKYNIKVLPVIGDVIAALSGLAETVLMLKDLYNFAQKIQEVSGVELQGIRSLLGDYTLIDASAEDLNAIADALEVSDMSEEAAKELYDLYLIVIGRFKQVLIDVLLTLKSLSLGTTIALAVTLSILPIEMAFKEVLFYTHEKLKEIKDQAPELISLYIDILNETFGGFIPILGFLLSNERVVAFARIDDAMNELAKRTSRDAALSAAEAAAYGSKRVYDIGQRIGDEVADDVADAFEKSLRNLKFENKIYNFDKFQKIYTK